MRQLSLFQRIVKSVKMALHPAQEKLICKPTPDPTLFS